MWDELDEKLGFPKYQEGAPKTGWLVNMVQVSPDRSRRPVRPSRADHSRAHQTLVTDDSNPQGQAGVDYYFIQDDGDMFKSTICYEPYFYIACRVRLACSAALRSGMTADPS